MVGRRAEVAAHVVGPLVEDEIQLRNNPSKGVSAGDDPRPAVSIGQHAVVWQMGMSGDQGVDLGVERIVNGDNRSGNAHTGVHRAGRRRL